MLKFEILEIGKFYSHTNPYNMNFLIKVLDIKDNDYSLKRVCETVYCKLYKSYI